MGIWYCTREDVKSALSTVDTARNSARIDRAIEAASRDVEKMLHRKFYPEIATRYFDWPDLNGSRPWRLWLDDNELISVTSLVAGGVTISGADYFLEPANSGPPYNRVEIDLASQAAFTSSATHQRAIAITGLYGYSADLEAVGQLMSDFASNADTPGVTWTRQVGIGDILLVDDEYLIVRARSMVDTTQDLQTPLTASNANVTVAVTTGSAFMVDDVLLLDSERMLVVDIAGNNLTVKRAWDGSVLAAHTGSDIYALASAEVDRAQLGSTAAAHSNGATIYRHLIPGPVRDLTIAEAINKVEQESSGYARTIGSGENLQNVSYRGLNDIRSRTKVGYGRNARMRTV